MPTRRFLLAAAGAAIASPVLAHHGLMIWDKDTIHVIEGILTEEMDGFPHWEITVRADDKDWTIDIGNDFELERAGFSPDGSEFTTGAKIRVEGYRPTDTESTLMRPKTIVLKGKTYEFVTDGY